MRPTRTVGILWITLLALALAKPGAGAGLPAPAPPGTPLRSGTVVSTPVPQLPPGVDEFELLLVPDAGPAIRLCPETPAGARVICWRVPLLAARHARLVWRAGGERTEWESPPSNEIELGPPPANELARVLQGRSDAGAKLAWATGDVPAGIAGASDAPSLSAGVTPACAVESGSPSLSVPRATSIARSPDPAAAASPTAARSTPDREPGFTPLRN